MLATPRPDVEKVPGGKCDRNGASPATLPKVRGGVEGGDDLEPRRIAAQANQRAPPELPRPVGLYGQGAELLRQAFRGTDAGNAESDVVFRPVGD